MTTNTIDRNQIRWLKIQNAKLKSETVFPNPEKDPVDQIIRLVEIIL